MREPRRFEVLRFYSGLLKAAGILVLAASWIVPLIFDSIVMNTVEFFAAAEGGSKFESVFLVAYFLVGFAGSLGSLGPFVASALLSLLVETSDDVHEGLHVLRRIDRGLSKLDRG